MNCSSIRRAARAAAVAVLAAGLALAYPPLAAHAGPTVIKMATLAPEGSSWHKILLEMGEAWKKETGGAVTLRIYPGGVAGDEDAMLRKIRVGQLQAAAVTGIGLTYVDRAFYALHVPMLYASSDELDYVREKMAPILEKRLQEKGLVVLNWGDAGWVHFFAKKPVARVSDMKAMKLSVWGIDTSLVQLYKDVGFQPVPLSTADVLPGLQTGLVTAFSSTPLAALALQWFGLAPYMTDLDWAYLSGATVIDRRAWNGIPEAQRTRILAACRTAGLKLRGEIRRLNDEAVRIMVRNGLKVVKVSPEAREEWRRTVESTYAKARGNVVPAEMFDAARKYRDEYRQGAGRKSRGK